MTASLDAQLDPQHQLAALIGGIPQASGAIITDAATVTASPTGQVRVGRHVLGRWTDPVADLASAYWAAVNAA